MKKIIILSCVFVFVLFFQPCFSDASLSPIKPKLVLVLVYDQFRADFLTRFEKDFLPPIKQKKVGGFRYLMEKGAYFPFAEYEILQAMTCPGHAMILTGSYPKQNGISLNSWYDRNTQKSMYCVEDAEFGFSPKKLIGTTVGDELKLISPQSRVVGVALKDRSAIMLAGHGADGAFWFDTASHEWVTSGYYPKPPTWLQEFNKPIKIQKDKVFKWTPKYSKHKFVHEEKKSSKEALSSPYGGELTLEMAKKLIKEYKLGQRQETDILAISFSTHDIAGHRFGPMSPEMDELTRVEDVQLSDLLNELNTHLIGGLNSVLVVLTADHGVAPTIEDSRKIKLDAGTLSNEQLISKLNSFYREKYSSIEANAKMVVSAESLNFYFNTDLIRQLKLDDAQILQQGRDFLMAEPGVQAVVVGKDVDNSSNSVLLMEKQIKKSVLVKKNGDLIVIPKPFWFEESKVITTHMTGYSYDRMVPLILMGPSVKTGR
mgnify:CR=1 FL=1